MWSFAVPVTASLPKHTAAASCTGFIASRTTRVDSSTIRAVVAIVGARRQDAL